MTENTTAAAVETVVLWNDEFDFDFDAEAETAAVARELAVLDRVARDLWAEWSDAEANGRTGLADTLREALSEVRAQASTLWAAANGVELV